VVLKQYRLGCLAHASYLIADEKRGQAAVIDPQRNVERYVEGSECVRTPHACASDRHRASLIAGARNRVMNSERFFSRRRYGGLASAALNGSSWVLG